MKIVEYCGSATRVHQCTEERHSECQFFLHQQVCVPNHSEQERLFHNDESLYYSKSTTLLEFLKEVLLMYYRRGLRVTLVHGDLEFGPLDKLVKELPRVPELDLEVKEEHVGDVERNIRYLKEKV